MNTTPHAVWIEKDRRTIGTGDAGVFLIRCQKIQKKGPKTCLHWFLFFSNDAHPSCLVKNTIPHAVWIEKDKRTFGTGVGWVFLIRGPTIQKKGAKPCSYWFLFFSNEAHPWCLVKNTIPHAVWIERDRRTIGTGYAWAFLIRGNFLWTCSTFNVRSF